MPGCLPVEKKVDIRSNDESSVLVVGIEEEGGNEDCWQFHQQGSQTLLCHVMRVEETVIADGIPHLHSKQSRDIFKKKTSAQSHI